MVDFPPYIRLVPSASLRRSHASGRTEDRAQASAHGGETQDSLPRDVFLRRTEGTHAMVWRENRMAVISDIPTQEQAEAALGRLLQDLPALGKGVENLHSELDSRRVLYLLAPLV